MDIRIDIYRGRRKLNGRRDWRWRMWSSSDVIANGGQGYANLGDLYGALETVTGGHINADGDLVGFEPSGLTIVIPVRGGR